MKDVLSESAFVKVKNNARAAGSTTHAGEERRSKGLGLHQLIDPSALGVIRRSLCRFEEQDGGFCLPNGVAMPVESLLDGTGSMGRENIDMALENLKFLYDQLSGHSLRRYDLQIATAMFGDTEDPCVLQRSQFEMNVKIAEQMTLFDLKGFSGQGNDKENPEYGIFGATFLTDFDIWRYGLKSYHSTISDEAVVHYLDPSQIERVYGKEVWEIVKQNGHDINRNNLPNTREMVEILLKRTHAFFYMFNEAYPGARPSWIECYGKDRVIEISRIDLLPFFQSAVIALTEGIADLHSIKDFLQQTEFDKGEGFTRVRKNRNLGNDDADTIVRAVSKIPLNAQSALPNFNKIPAKGSMFSKKRDLWPVGFNAEGDQVREDVSSSKGKPTTRKKKTGMWT